MSVPLARPEPALYKSNEHQLEHHEHDAKAIADHELHGTTFSRALRRTKKASEDLSFSRTPRKEKQMFAKVYDLCGL